MASLVPALMGSYMYICMSVTKKQLGTLLWLLVLSKICILHCLVLLISVLFKPCLFRFRFYILPFITVYIFQCFIVAIRYISELLVLIVFDTNINITCNETTVAESTFCFCFV